MRKLLLKTSVNFCYRWLITDSYHCIFDTQEICSSHFNHLFYTHTNKFDIFVFIVINNFIDNINSSFSECIFKLVRKWENSVEKLWVHFHFLINRANNNLLCFMTVFLLSDLQMCAQDGKCMQFRWLLKAKCCYFK